MTEKLTAYYSGQSDFEEAVIDLRVLLNAAESDGSITQDLAASYLSDVKLVSTLGRQWLLMGIL